MSLSTRSQFFYGHTVTRSNASLDFSEGSGELQATIPIGSYTPEELCAAIKVAMEAVGALTYTVTFTRSSAQITITAASNFSLLCNSGSRVGTTIFTLMGFSTASDRTGASTYSGDTTAGSVFRPQHVLQDYVGPDFQQEMTDAVVNESASGEVQVAQFGRTRFFSAKISLQTNVPRPGSPSIEDNPSGVEDLQAFMQFAITKAKLQFMPDRDQPENFYNCLLEKTPASAKGTSYALSETKSGPGVWNTGDLRFRLLTT